MRFRISARALVVSTNDRLLVVEVEDPSAPTGAWLTVPGGGLRLGERAVTAARRETQEEVGFLLGPATAQSPWHVERFRFRGQRHCVLEKAITFLLPEEPDPSSLSGEIRAARWLDRSEILSEKYQLVPRRITSLALEAIER